MNYFDLPEVSSSDLGALKREYYGLPDNREQLEEIFNFGSLVDAMLTEREKLDYLTLGLRQENGFYIYYTYDTWRRAEVLAEAARKDPVIGRMLDWMVGQYIFRRTLSFDYQGDEYKIRARCKFDLLAKKLLTGLDFKTTACTTQKQFEESIDFFDWDKQASYYMDISKNNYHWIVGISKKNDKIFKYAIERGDAMHKRGADKYSVWAYRWVTLIEPFQTYNLKLVA
jgi:hypothetical protein